MGCCCGQIILDMLVGQFMDVNTLAPAHYFVLEQRQRRRQRAYNPFFAYCYTHRAVFLKSSLSVRYCLATTPSCGSSGCGDDNKACVQGAQCVCLSGTALQHQSLWQTLAVGH